MASMHDGLLTRVGKQRAKAEEVVLERERRKNRSQQEIKEED